MECRSLPPIAKALHALVVEGEGVTRAAFFAANITKLYVDRDKFNKNISALNQSDKHKGVWDFKASFFDSFDPLESILPPLLLNRLLIA